MKPQLAAVDGPLKGQVFELSEASLTIGRGPGNRVVLADPSASREHCAISRAGDRFRITDLDSHNGTFVNGQPMRDVDLSDGDEIRAGRSVFRVLLTESPEPGSSVRFNALPVDDCTAILLRPQDSVYLQPEEAMAAAAPLARAARGYRALLRIAAALRGSGGTERLTRQFLEALSGFVPEGTTSVVLLRDGDGEVTAGGAYCRSRAVEASPEINRSVVERAWREGTAVLAGGQGGGGTPRSILAVPLVSGDRRIGAIYLRSGTAAGAFSEEDLQLLAAVGLMAGAVFEDASEFDRLEARNRLLLEEVRVRHEMVGESPKMSEVYQTVAKVGPAGSTVLVLGETGTGKELVARAIHRSSQRHKGPFIAINSASLTEPLLESELFGHEKGAFTGAVAQKRGKLELADGGTLFLDEIGELPLPLQTKLLRVLQERQFERVGGIRSLSVDIRLIAATNRDLQQEIERGAFRRDLFYRLNVVTLRLPPLRDRREDIPLLAEHFLTQYAEQSDRRISGISDLALQCLIEHDWPGNVRELQNAIERAVVLGVSAWIEPEDLPETVLECSATDTTRPGSYTGALKRHKGEVILAAIRESDGNISAAARLLGLHPNYLHRLIRNLGLRAMIQKL